ncbi:MAG: hypothetical protein K8R21_12845 [Leptospira sp.]|nr:hypothetical protein [Leptospira sp.]
MFENIKDNATSGQRQKTFMIISKHAAISAIFLTLLLLTFGIEAETILLRDGNSLKGKITAQNFKEITIAVTDQEGQTKEVSVNKSNIIKVVYHDLQKEEEEKLRAMEDEKNKSLGNEKLKQEQEEKQKLAYEEKRLQEEADRKSQENIRKKEERGSRFGALARSAILPGWGQWHGDRKITGIIWPVLFLSTAGALYRQNQIYHFAQKDYDALNNPYSQLAYTKLLLNPGSSSQSAINSTDLLDPTRAYIYNKTNQTTQQRKDVEQHYVQVRNIGYLLAGIYVLNLIDAFVFHNDVDFSAQNRGFFMDYSARAFATNVSSTGSMKYDQLYTLGYNFVF